MADTRETGQPSPERQRARLLEAAYQTLRRKLLLNTLQQSLPLGSKP
jgi:hypothetical protein